MTPISVTDYWKPDFYNIECNDLYLIHHESVSRGNDELSEAAMEKLTKSRSLKLHPAMMNKSRFSRHFNKAMGLWPFALEVAPAYSATDIKNADSLFAGDMAEKWKSDVIRVGVDNAALRTITSRNFRTGDRII